jgi:hypothetical protein
MMARQQARMGTNMHMAQAQAGMGLGMRGIGTGGAAMMGGAMGAGLGLVSGIPGGMLMGGMAGAAAGGLGFEHMGGGQAMQNFGSAMMAPMIRQRQQSLMLQNQSMGFVRGGADASSSGIGLSMGASTRLSSQLNQMSGSQSFQRDTGGRFNRQDVMKITRLAGEMGMLEQSQTADQIKDSIGKISRSLSNFMKIAEEPDVQEAMRMMGQMRSMGMSVGQTSTAAANARQFARMAGTSTRGVMAAGMQGAGQFQQVGLSGASGLNAGMAAQGMAGQMAAFMTPAQLAMAGGRSGVAGTISGQAARAGVMDSLLPGMLRRRGGQLTVDREAIMGMATGQINMHQMHQRSANTLRDRRSINELTGERRRELQNEIQSAMGGQLSTLMPLIQARAVMQSAPGLTMGQALRTTGMGEQEANTFARMARTPEFWQNMREQQRVRFREERSELGQQREQIARDAIAPDELNSLARQADRLLQRGSSAMDRAGTFLGNMSDDAEARGMDGGDGRIVGTARRSRLGSSVQRAHIRDLSRTRTGRETLRSGMTTAGRAATRGIEEETAEEARNQTRRNEGVTGLIEAELTQRYDEFMTGGESQRSVVNRGVDFGTRLNRRFGYENPTTAQIQREAAGQRQIGARFERAANMSSRARDSLLSRTRRASTANFGSEAQADRLSAVAAAAINQHAHEHTSAIGAALGIDGAIDVNQQREFVRARLLAAGATPAQANEAVTSEDFMTQAASEGEGSRSERAQSAIETTINQGGEEAGRERTQRQRISRAQADTLRETALGRLGIESGIFSDTSESQRTAVLDVIGGQGPQSDMRRKALTARALQRAARADPGNQDLMQRAQRAERAFLASGGTDEDRAEIRASLSGLEDSTLVTMGRSLAAGSEASMATRMGASAEEVQQAGMGEADTELRRIIGEQGVEALNEGGIGGLRSLLETTGGGLGREQRNRLIEGIRSGGMDEASLRGRAARQADDRREGVTGGTMSQLAEEYIGSDFGDIVASIEDFATRGGEAPGAAVRDPQNFEEAVGVFSQASTQLLAASESMNSGGDILGLGNIVNTGSPLANMVMAPAHGAFQLLNTAINVWNRD